MAGAAAVILVEKMPYSDKLYFAFVTGLTIGYGDIVVKTPFGRLTAILIGFIGNWDRMETGVGKRQNAAN